MNKLINFLVAAMFLVLLPMKSFAQPTRITNNEPTISFDITDIANFDERVFFLYNLITDGRFEVINGEQDGVFVISESETFEGINLRTVFNDFRTQNADDFTRMSKEQAADVAAEFKGLLPHEFISSLMMDYYIRSRENNTCANADPFCTDNGMYQFPAGVNAGSGETGPYYDCLYTQPNPAWYYMRIANPGSITIHMYSTPSVDIDFCCWGPYPTITNPSPCSSLTSNKVVSCSYSTSATENCIIPSTAQTGDYFILIITNYSNTACNISFSKTAGTGTTDCGILPPMVDNDGPYCVGEPIHLTANGQAGASYSWTGPGGFTSNQQNPTRPNCTMNMAGTYTCTITVGSQTNSATTDVVIYPQPNANFNFTSVCQGTPTQFTSTSTTNPSGQQISGYHWSFGDGQSSTQQNPSHQYASAGTYQVTLTVNCGNGHCTSSKTQTVTVYSQPAANAGPDQTINYGASTQLNGSGGAGSFNFHWEPANMVVNANAQNTQTVSLTQDQTYTLTVSNPQGDCSSTDEVTIHINGGAMTASAYADPSSICQGGSTQLVANAGGGTGNFTYSWTPTTDLSNPNIYNPIASPTQTTTYSCHVTDGQTSQNVSVTVTVNDIIVEHEYMHICPGQVFYWHGTPYEASPEPYQFDTVTEQGCLKTLYLHLDNYPSYDETSIDTAICSGESFDFFGTSYNYSIFNLPHTLHTSHGCDSIVRLNLTVWPELDTTLRVTVCPELLPYTFYGENYYDDADVTVLDTDIHGCNSAVRLILTISDHYEPPIEYRYVGYYDTPLYNWYIPEADTTITYTQGGRHIETLPAGACEGIFTLELSFRPIPPVEIIIDSACNTYPWYVNGYLVDNYTTSCNVTHNIPLCETPNNLNTQYMYYDPSDPNNPIPCFESHELHLIVNHDYIGINNPIVIDGDNLPPGEKLCDSYDWQFGWNGETHHFTGNTGPNGFIDTIPTRHECDSVVKLIIKNMQYTPQPEIYCTQIGLNGHWPITATEFNVNAYTYRVKDSVSDITRWNTSQCKWDITKLSWRLVTNPDDPLECTVYAMDWVPDSICLSFKAVNSCSDGEIAEYWLHPSFYGIEEQEAYPAYVSVIPNPNNGQMRLQFDNMKGDLNIKVYSLTGTLVDAFELKSIEVGQSHEYSMKRLMNGIYFFTISDGKRSVTKKVVVIH